LAEVTKAKTLTDDRSAANLLREMRERAEAEREAILEAARRRAVEIEEQNRRECERVEREGVAHAERELAAERDRLLGTAREETRAARVALKRAEIDHVFEAAAEVIEKRAGGPEWEEALSALLDEAVRFVGPGAAIGVAKEDLALARKWLESSSPESTATVEPGPRGKVAATSADGRRRAENGLASRLRRVKESGSAGIAGVLFAAR